MSSPSSSDEEFIYTLGHENSTPKVPEITVKVNSVPIEITIDTGASAHVFDEGALTRLAQAQGIELSHSSARLMAYG